MRWWSWLESSALGTPTLRGLRRLFSLARVRRSRERLLTPGIRKRRFALGMFLHTGGPWTLYCRRRASRRAAAGIDKRSVALGCAGGSWRESSTFGTPTLRGLRRLFSLARVRLERGLRGAFFLC